MAKGSLLETFYGRGIREALTRKREEDAKAKAESSPIVTENGQPSPGAPGPARKFRLNFAPGIAFIRGDERLKPIAANTKSEARAKWAAQHGPIPSHSEFEEV